MERTNPHDGQEYRQIEMEKDDTEHDALLPTSGSPPPYMTSAAPHSADRWRLVLSFIGGVVVCAVAQSIASQFCSESHAPSSGSSIFKANNGHFPPPKPTNAVPSLFPTNVGYPGPTPTGVEAGIVATAPAYPQHTGAPGLLLPQKIKGSSNASFDLFKSWGNLSPWYTVPSADFGLPEASPMVPDQCRVTGLHILHRHGARYPTEFSLWGGPARMRDKFKSSNFTARGELEFLNDWSYALGAEILTPFGRHQLYDLGVSMRMRYGFLLQNFTQTNTVPVFRTESQNRMLESAMNFALGFFGNPIGNQYQQLVMIRESKINNTASPDLEFVFHTSMLCPYETVALGYSKFCGLFTQDEWEGFHYALDLGFWYNDVFGSPVSLALGAGWVKEMIARLTHTPVAVHDSTTNSTLHNLIQFPLNDALYVDVTHETTFMKILVAMNLTRFLEDEPLPWTHIAPNRKFQSSQAAPFATNMQIQLLSCATHSEPQLRVIINDGVVPLDGLEGCPKDKDGMCSVDKFVEAQKASIKQADFEWTCRGDWQVPPGPEWNTTTGVPPAKPGIV
ncbi:histidine phosphatase family containing protein [Ceratobasidium sp. AG-Ba]|nr:histidine phosphatase family containing protein [Ceratobasidium sp. AG-Ba]